MSEHNKKTVDIPHDITREAREREDARIALEQRMKDLIKKQNSLSLEFNGLSQTKKTSPEGLSLDKKLKLVRNQMMEISGKLRNIHTLEIQELRALIASLEPSPSTPPEQQ